GDFVVVWSSNYQDGSGTGVFGQRYSSTGAALGAEFQVNTYTTNPQLYPVVAAGRNGNFVVVWDSVNQIANGSGDDLFGQAYDSAGTTRGREFQVNTYTTGSQFLQAVSSDGFGNFVVVWASGYLDRNVFGRRFIVAPPTTTTLPTCGHRVCSDEV